MEEEDFFNADVYLTPPNDGKDSDKDSDNVDDPNHDPDHLSGNQLQSQAEFCIKYPTKLVNSLENGENDVREREEGNITQSSLTDYLSSESELESEESEIDEEQDMAQRMSKPTLLSLQQPPIYWYQEMES